ncbi:dTDP-4-dehydrorhamnose 3,5-epimerase family protein [Streptomyces chitinivorans]|uniref:dTDP-4-dehydrorhamnose 3,5-epimerase family protein n=1 Tax=Streptomyces chitinivorans TaxID=1257027 RepID=A0ABW7HYA9_9ACTN|nr:dTDP-4-dehydrorhamnose 3,5-epimerase [Streptomyces chitinivorans]MDH2409213.1 dTDP-4-dehydrorhamnose 3,5-epimerase [Streptomyces chitinivorans]
MSAQAVRELKVQGAFEFTPTVFPDHRGVFVDSYQRAALTAAAGHPFPLAQASHSRSRRGVVRGVHFTAAPPGMAKYVHCTRGRALDLVVDLRVGSPTFGQWDTVDLDEEHCRSTYLPVGVGHAFVALEDGTTMVYLMSGDYVPGDEYAVSPLDPDLALPLDLGGEPVLSQRDRDAPTLEQALRLGILPDYRTSLALEERLGRR